MSSTLQSQNSPVSASVSSSRPDLIMVLGMHRSGTSAVTRGLRVLGTNLGDNLMHSVPGSNDKGFFEDLDVVAVNEALLRKIGSRWNRLSVLDPSIFAGDDFFEERCRAAALLQEKLSPETVYAVKDPRLSILLPFWTCVQEDLGLKVRVLIVVRHPLEVGRSLARRDQIPVGLGAMLWAKHNVAAIEGTAGLAREFISFDALLAQPYDELTRVADGLGLPPVPRNASAMEDYVSDFLESQLRHHKLGRSELDRYAGAPHFVKDLYDLLCSWADGTRDPSSEPPEPLWTTVKREMADFQLYARMIDELEVDREGLRASASKAQAQLDEAQNTLGEREEVVASLKRQLDRQINAVSLTEAEKQKIEQEVERLRLARVADRAEADENVRQLEEKLASSIAETGDAADQRDEWAENAEALAGRVGQLEATERDLTARLVSSANVQQQLSAQICRADIELETLIEDRRLLRTQKEAADQRLAEADDVEAMLRSQLDVSHETIEGLREELEIAALDQEDLTRTRRLLRSTRSEFLGLQQEWQAGELRLKNQSARADYLQQQIQQQQRQARFTRRELVVARFEANAIAGSRFWRFGAPLRMVGRVIKRLTGQRR